MAIVRTKLSDGQELLIETKEPLLTKSVPDEYGDEYREAPKIIQKVVESAQDLFGDALNNGGGGPARGQARLEACEQTLVE